MKLRQNECAGGQSRLEGKGASGGRSQIVSKAGWAKLDGAGWSGPGGRGVEVSEMGGMLAKKDARVWPRGMINTVVRQGIGGETSRNACILRFAERIQIVKSEVAELLGHARQRRRRSLRP